MTGLDVIGRTLRMRRPHPRRRPGRPAGYSWRTQWLTALACGLFGLAMVMVVVVLTSGPRAVDRLTRPGPPPTSVEAPPTPAAPPSPASRTESPPHRANPQRATTRHDTAQPDAGTAPSAARELARRWAPSMVDGFPGMPAP